MGYLPFKMIQDYPAFHVLKSPGVQVGGQRSVTRNETAVYGGFRDQARWCRKMVKFERQKP